MQLYCPHCKAAFSSGGRCPRCDGRLVTPAEAFESAAELVSAPPEPLRPTATARAILGSVVAAGMYLGLREWAAAGYAAAGTAEPWDQPGGYVLAVVLRVIAVLVGGAIAGAGRPGGAGSGGIVGLACGAATLATDVVGGATAGLTDGLVLGGLTAVAAAAGWVGSRVWPSPIELPAPTYRTHGSSLLQLARDDERQRAPKPTRWLRVLAGASAAILAVAAAETIRNTLKYNTGGYLHIGGPVQAPYVCMEIAGLLVIVSATAAAGGTGAGLRHGVLTGLAAGATIAGLTALGVPAVTIVVEGVVRTFDMPADNMTSNSAVATAFLAVLFGCAVGGWLGGTLLPPLAPPWLRSRALGELS